MLHQRYKRRVENYISLTKELSTESIDTKDTVIDNAERGAVMRTESDDPETTRNRIRSNGVSQDTCPSSATPPDIEDLCRSIENDNNLRTNELCSSSYACSGPSRQQCQDLVNDYHQRQQLEFTEFYHSIQSFRHTVLLILLLCSMFVVSAFFCYSSLLLGCLAHCLNWENCGYFFFFSVDLIIRVDADHGGNVGHLCGAVIFGGIFKFWPKCAGFRQLHHRHRRFLENYSALLAQIVTLQPR